MNTAPTAKDIAQALNGKKSGSGWLAKCPCHPDRRPSLSVTDDGSGRPLVHCHAGCDQALVWSTVLELCGVDEAPQQLRQARPLPPTNREDKDEFRPITPIPTDAIPPKSHQQLGEPTKIFTYRDSDGSTLCYQLRWDSADGSKEIRPLTYGHKGQSYQWRYSGLPEPRPLYNLDKLTLRGSAPVLLVEGEKTAEAATEIVDDQVVITWPNGSGGVSKADWSS